MSDNNMKAKLLADALEITEAQAASYLSGAETAAALATHVNSEILTNAHVTEMTKNGTLTEPLLVALLPKAPENIVPELAKILRARQDTTALAQLLKDCREGGIFQSLSRAKATKCVRSVLDEMTQIAGVLDTVLKCTQECADWAMANHQNFLRQRLDLRLCSLYLETRDLDRALASITKLLAELRKLDDKPMLVEALLVESAIHRARHNLPKAKAALTGARANANQIYCPQKLQGELDLQSGIVNADEHDYRTAFSYFFEACEGFVACGDHRARTAFTYMMLAKVMSQLYNDVPALLTAKNAQQFVGTRQVAAMEAITKACKERSLHAFTCARTEFADAVGADADAFVAGHLDQRYSALLEENLQRIIEPFSRVEVEHVAALIGLPQDLVERRLSQMILDAKIDGILDQGAGTLIVFDRPQVAQTSRYALETMSGLNNVVDRLYDKALNVLV